MPEIGPESLKVPEFSTKPLDQAIDIDDDIWGDDIEDLVTDGFNSIPHDVENGIRALTEELGILEKELRPLTKKTVLGLRSPSRKKTRELHNLVDDAIGQILNIETRRFETWHPNQIDPATIIGIWKSEDLALRVAHDLKAQRKNQKKIHGIEAEYRLKLSDTAKRIHACVDRLLESDPTPSSRERYQAWGRTLDRLENL